MKNLIFFSTENRSFFKKSKIGLDRRIRQFIGEIYNCRNPYFSLFFVIKL
ncbi:hypothetical protein ADIS_1713 [Lunatimonas lonarensis]|uniref:Uncharacterized protein n=1 Tax=Lunatimonas lonarensis TaxID=1232681 RepID=R7ZUY2_9BACT|nr:hypothetical protein ADIS_1713 [Lunatimonas lonarensis]